MQKQIKYRTLFVLHRRSAKDAPRVQFRLRWESRSLAMSTGMEADPAKWDGRAQRCAPGSFHGPKGTPASAINAELRRWEDAAAETLDGFARDGHVPSVDEARNALQAALFLEPGESSGGGVTAAFDEFCREQGEAGAWSDGTRAKWGVFRRHMLRWRRDPQWADFSEAGLVSFLAYLREGRGFRNSTAGKTLALMRWFLSWADRKGFPTGAAYRTFRPKFKGQDIRPVIFLTWGELMSLWEWDASGHEYRGNVRDVFCFCCFTSLRFSDAENLRWTDVGRDSIRVTAVKTAEPLEIQLNGWSRELLGRHVDEDNGGDRVFPRIPNQVFNRELHALCRECGIDEPVHRTWYRGARRVDEVAPKWSLISSHAGRRTFICNALAMGIPAAVVMQWTGHSDYDSMRPYIGVSQETKAAAMRLFDERGKASPGDPETP